MRKYLNIMIKPASSMCNLRCRYCFYLDETKNRSIPNYGIMKDDTIEAVIRKALAECSGCLTLAFQGGEPVLAGLDFFRKVIESTTKYNRNHCQVEFLIQTNGTLLDEEWCRFFRENRFLVGISLDGTRSTHDRNRLDTEGNGTFDRVMKALEMLMEYQVEFNILTVLTPKVCLNYNKIYRFYEKNGWNYQQYIPCLDPYGEERGNQIWSLTPELFEIYLITSFDCWYQDYRNGRKKYHRYFDNILLMLAGNMPEACGMGGICGMQYVVEADGSVFPCDFYVMDQYCLGNFKEDSFESLDQKRREIRFIEESQVIDAKCRACKWLRICRGGCRRDRDFFDAGIKKNYYCEAYAHFFAYSIPKFYSLLS